MSEDAWEEEKKVRNFALKKKSNEASNTARIVMLVFNHEIGPGVISQL